MYFFYVYIYFVFEKERESECLKIFDKSEENKRTF